MGPRMAKRLKLRDVMDRLPDDCAAWIPGLKPGYQEIPTRRADICTYPRFFHPSVTRFNGQKAPCELGMVTGRTVGQFARG
jgi:hypothetical protein